MNPTRAWIVYIFVRVLAFVIPFGIIMLVLPNWQWNWLLAVVVATVVALSISEIFLGKQRGVIGAQMRERRERKGDGPRPIDLEEDALIDAQQTETAPQQDMPTQGADADEDIEPVPGADLPAEQDGPDDDIEDVPNADGSRA